MSTIKKFVIFVLKYVSPLFLMLVPLVAIYGLINPWPPSAAVLSKYPGSLALLSGMQSHYNGSYKKNSKTYLIVTTDIFASKTVKVTVDSNGLFEVKENEGGLFFMLTTYLLLTVLTWWFWFRPKRNTHNE
jgi:hypothetical protein